MNQRSHHTRLLLGTALGLLGGLVLGRRVVREVRARSFRLEGKTVLITGGSRGLGLELAREYAARGARVALLARDRAELDRAQEDLEARGAVVWTHECDVRKGRDITIAIQRVITRWGRLDVIVNNAGVIKVGPVDDMILDDFDEAIATHFSGPLQVVRAALPYLRQQREGRIVNIASVGGKIAVPHLLPYCASKFALVGLSDGLRAELRREGIFVTTVCPGLMRTGSTTQAEFKGQHEKEHAWFTVADSLPFLSISSRRAARKIVDASQRGDARLVVGLPAKLAVLGNEMMPELSANVVALVAGWLPSATRAPGKVSKKGWKSGSAITNSFLTALSRKAAEKNNENPA